MFLRMPNPMITYTKVTTFLFLLFFFLSYHLPNASNVPALIKVIAYRTIFNPKPNL